MEYGGLVALIGAIGTVAGTILGLFGKWLLDYYQKRSDTTISELKAKVESQKTEREAVFAEAMTLIKVAQEREEAAERERSSMRDELTVMRHELDKRRDEITALRHELDKCREELRQEKGK